MMSNLQEKRQYKTLGTERGSTEAKIWEVTIDGKLNVMLLYHGNALVLSINKNNIYYI